MKTVFLLTVVSCLWLFVSTSCLDDDDSTPHYLELGVTDYGPDDQPLVITDSETTLQLRNSPVGFDFDDSVRVLMKYSIIQPGSENDVYDYLADALSIQEVVTDSILVLDQISRDTIGSDYIYIDQIWISGGFLNLRFAFYGDNKTHDINMVIDPEEQTDDENKIYLQVRHNKRNDSEVSRYWGLISFYLDPLQVEGHDKVTLVFENQGYYGPFDEIELEYEY
ncbi:NigD1/NigD2 family lipoprotein [Thermophagus sp. OGC60D27]|uniref:NigD1/NigD2 family lipoprotein n=1 Tax=Thermophagus sp. OGC60D27 TaxID=3458415 RepID=UPI0040379B53